jgi:hypothetical protein
MTFRTVRIAILLGILGMVATGAWLDRARTTDWDVPLWVAIYPINADGSAVSSQYIGSLTPAQFQSIEEFMTREGSRFGLRLERPASVRLYDPVRSLPPQLEPGANVLSRALWSLRLRYWSSRATSGQPYPPPNIRMFVLFHDPALAASVPHSLGLQKGLVGVVHVFADRSMDGSNAIVIAHELLHTLGATDKYDPADDRPSYPDGFGDPAQEPLYPQRRAEIMAGRRMLSDSQWEMPASLRDVVVGPKTALEINWTHR